MWIVYASHHCLPTFPFLQQHRWGKMQVEGICDLLLLARSPKFVLATLVSCYALCSWFVWFFSQSIFNFTLTLQYLELQWVKSQDLLHNHTGCFTVPLGRAYTLLVPETYFLCNMGHRRLWVECLSSFSKHITSLFFLVAIPNPHI